jgi:hypothetical protein
VTQSCNPSYSGGRDQEDCGSKLAWANSSLRPYLGKTLHRKRVGGVGQSVCPEFILQQPQKRKKRKETEILSLSWDWSSFSGCWHVWVMMPSIFAIILLPPEDEAVTRDDRVKGMEERVFGDSFV